VLVGRVLTTTTTLRGLAGGVEEGLLRGLEAAEDIVNVSIRKLIGTIHTGV
jgi:hypothetical protein